MGKFQRKFRQISSLRRVRLPRPAPVSTARSVSQLLLLAGIGLAASGFLAAQVPAQTPIPNQPAPNQPAPNQPAPKRPEPNRPVMSGASKNALPTSGPAMAGPVVGGPVVGGPAMSSPPASGPAMNGPAMSGPAMSGPAGAVLAERIVQRLDDIQQALGRGDTGAKTQAAQAGLVDLLDQLAAAAERQEAAEQGEGGGASAGAAGQPKPMPAPAPSLAADRDEKPEKDGAPPPASPSADGPTGAWGKLPAQQREAFLQSLREKRFPARYQRILEQYYRGFREPTP